MNSNCKTIIFLLFYVFSLKQIVAQQNVCRNIYVWNFLNEAGKQTNKTKFITDEFESNLTQNRECVVLGRRDFSMQFEQQTNEKSILSLNDIKQYNEPLKTIKAEIVVFGKITHDTSSNIYILLVRFLNIETSQLLRSNSVNIPRETMERNIEELRNIIHTFVNRFIPNESDTNNVIITLTNPRLLKDNNWNDQVVVNWLAKPSESGASGDKYCIQGRIQNLPNRKKIKVTLTVSSFGTSFGEWNQDKPYINVDNTFNTCVWLTRSDGNLYQKSINFYLLDENDNPRMIYSISIK